METKLNRYRVSFQGLIGRTLEIESEEAARRKMYETSTSNSAFEFDISALYQENLSHEPT